MNPVSRLARVTDAQAARMVQPATLADLAERLISMPADAADAEAAAGRITWRSPWPRRWFMLTSTVTGMAVTAAAVVLAATAGPGRLPGHAHGAAPPQTTAYVLSRMERTLRSAARGSLIEEVHTVAHGPAFGLGYGTFPDAVATRAVTWWYIGRSLMEGLSATGGPLFDTSSSYSYPPHRVVIRSMAVDYAGKSWWRTREEASQSPGSQVWAQRHLCQAGPLPLSSLGSPGLNWAAEIHQALSCRTYRIAGTGQIGGVDVIEIVPRSPGPPLWAHRSPSQALWVSRATYLPVRVQWTWRYGHRAHGSLTGDFTWLPPTRANLASLQPAIPAGFRQRPSGSGPPPMISYLPASAMPLRHRGWVPLVPGSFP